MQNVLMADHSDFSIHDSAFTIHSFQLTVGRLSFRQLRSLVVRVVGAAESFGQELHQVGLLRRGDLDVEDGFRRAMRHHLPMT